MIIKMYTKKFAVNLIINIKIIEKTIDRGTATKIITHALPSVITFESIDYKPNAFDICYLILSDFGRHNFLTLIKI